MNTQKATRSQIRDHNLKLILRAVHAGLADNRAALSTQTGLTKPAVSDLIGELMEDGYLIETGRGKSSKTGGKRPRLLEFVPSARQVIGVSVAEDLISGLLADLNGHILAEHTLQLPDDTIASHDDIIGVINGLVAQLDAPLLCVGLGLPVQQLTDQQSRDQTQQLIDKLAANYAVPIYVANNIELTATAQYAFVATADVSSLVTLRINHHVEIAYVLDNANYRYGRDIGAQHLSTGNTTIEKLLGWSGVQQRAKDLTAQFPDTILPSKRIRYLDIREARSKGDTLATTIYDELATALAEVFSWVISLLRPDHLILSGGVADLGRPFLDVVIEKLNAQSVASAVQQTRITLSHDDNISARGAVAYALQQDLGLVQWQLA